MAKAKFKLESSLEGGVFDTLCKACGELKSECKCSKNAIDSTKKSKLKCEVKKINNKIVSSFYPLYCENTSEILKVLKKKIGCGGSLERLEDSYKINLQGDVREKAGLILKNEFGFELA